MKASWTREKLSLKQNLSSFIKPSNHTYRWNVPTDANPSFVNTDAIPGLAEVTAMTVNPWIGTNTTQIFHFFRVRGQTISGTPDSLMSSVARHPIGHCTSMEKHAVQKKSSEHNLDQL